MLVKCVCNNVFAHKFGKNESEYSCPLCARLVTAAMEFTGRTPVSVLRRRGNPVRPYDGVYEYPTDRGDGGKIPSHHTHD